MHEVQNFSRVSIAALFFTFLFGFFSATAEAADRFISEAMTPAQRAALPAEVLRSRDVTLDTNLLAATAVEPNETSLSSQASTLELELFADTTVTAELQEIFYPSPDSWAWVGSIQGDPYGSVILVEREGVVAGTIQLSNTEFRIRYNGKQIHRVEELNPVALPPLDDTSNPTLGSGGKSIGHNPIGSEDGSRIDLLVVYTAAAKAEVGGTQALLAEIDLGVTSLNLSLAQSGLNTRVLQVHTEEIDYVEGPSVSADIAYLGNGSHGLQIAHTLRNQHGADLVALIVAQRPIGFLGLANIPGPNGDPNRAFSVSVARVLNDSQHLFAHELGHTLGAGHAPDDPWHGPFSFSHGYKDPQAGFRTIMAYSCYPAFCQPLRRFSSSSRLHQGLPTGNAGQDNTRSINELSVAIANYRPPSSCPLALGHPDYCLFCGPCQPGEGDCDSDMQCAPGASCRDNVGAAYGFTPGTDVCVADCPWPEGHARYCLDCGPCGDGQGDCDGDAQCAPGLSCIDNVGPNYGFGPEIDVCEEPAPPCPWSNGDPQYCTDCGPCGAGEGDCDSDLECSGGTFCVDDVGADYGFNPAIDVCEAPCPWQVGDPRYCTDCGPCGDGEGDCDSDAECEGGLLCVDDVGALYGFGATTDVCEAPPSGPQTLTLEPTADAWVGEEGPDTNHGFGSWLRIRNGATGLGRYTFLRFEVPTLSGPILSAQLRVHTGGATIPEAGFYGVEGTTWTEGSVTWNNWSQGATYFWMRSLHNLAPQQWATVDVTEAVTTSGTVTLGIASGIDQGSMAFYSRSTSLAPVLEVTYAP